MRNVTHRNAVDFVIRPLKHTKQPARAQLGPISVYQGSNDYKSHFQDYIITLIQPKTTYCLSTF